MARTRFMSFAAYAFSTSSRAEAACFEKTSGSNSWSIASLIALACTHFAFVALNAYTGVSVSASHHVFCTTRWLRTPSVSVEVPSNGDLGGVVVDFNNDDAASVSVSASDEIESPSASVASPRASVESPCASATPVTSAIAVSPLLPPVPFPEPRASQRGPPAVPRFAVASRVAKPVVAVPVSSPGRSFCVASDGLANPRVWVVC
mmetsp:Transcript_10647/g.35226  ORF Transcript_10647/g.35226 Transcript_10647/m.35226 type:complete len:205 (+) Transcript_10647:1026-1640(+)